MMGVDLSKIQPGDEVLIRCRVHRIGPVDGDYRGRQYVVCENPYESKHAADFVAVAERIAAHTPQPRFAVGDRVKSRDWRDVELRILCLHGPWAWLADAEGATTQLPLSQLAFVSGSAEGVAPRVEGEGSRETVK